MLKNQYNSCKENTAKRSKEQKQVGHLRRKRFFWIKQATANQYMQIYIEKAERKRNFIHNVEETTTTKHVSKRLTLHYRRYKKWIYKRQQT